MNDAEDMILESMTRHLNNFKPVKGCEACNHEIINCLNHTHCSFLGYELICSCKVCDGTGKPKEEKNG